MNSMKRQRGGEGTSKTERPWTRSVGVCRGGGQEPLSCRDQGTVRTKTEEKGVPGKEVTRRDSAESRTWEWGEKVETNSVKRNREMFQGLAPLPGDSTGVTL